MHTFVKADMAAALGRTENEIAAVLVHLIELLRVKNWLLSPFYDSPPRSSSTSYHTSWKTLCPPPTAVIPLPQLVTTFLLPSKIPESLLHPQPF